MGHDSTRRGVLRAAGTGLLGGAFAAASDRARSAAERWPQPGYGPGNSAAPTGNTGPTADPAAAWSKRPADRGGLRVTSGPVVDGDTVYLAGQVGPDGGDEYLHALAVADGRRRWRIGGQYAVCAVVDGAVLTISDGRLEARSAADGHRLWRTGSVGGVDRDALLGRVVVHGDAVAVLSGSTVRSFALSDGSERWTADVSGTEIARRRGNFAARGIAADGDTVYVAAESYDVTATTVADMPTSADGDVPVFALAAGDGSTRWARDVSTDGAYKTPSPPVVRDGTVALCYNRPEGYRVVAADAASGRVQWRREFDGDAATAPTVTERSVYAVDYRTPGTVTALSRADGSTRWRKGVGSAYRPPTVVDGTVYVVDFTGRTHALAAEDGAERWEFVPPDTAETSSGVQGLFGASNVQRLPPQPVAHGALFLTAHGEISAVTGGGSTPGTAPRSGTATPTGSGSATGGTARTATRARTRSATPAASGGTEGGLPVSPLVGGATLLAGVLAVGGYYRFRASGAGAADPGTAWVENAGGERVECRVRCRTAAGTAFDEMLTIDPGETTAVGPLPAEEFAIDATVRGGPTDRRRFDPDGELVGDVTVRLRPDGVEIASG